MVKELKDVEKELINVELEKSKVNRERSLFVLNKGLFLYFSFLFIGVIGFVNDYVNQVQLNTMIGMGLVVLIITTIPYIKTMQREERSLDELIVQLKKKI